MKRSIENDFRGGIGLVMRLGWEINMIPIRNIKLIADICQNRCNFMYKYKSLFKNLATIGIK